MERSCIQEGGDGTKFDVISLWIVFKTATEGDVHWRPMTEPTRHSELWGWQINRNQQRRLKRDSPKVKRKQDRLRAEGRQSLKEKNQICQMTSMSQELFVNSTNASQRPTMG